MLPLETVAPGRLTGSLRSRDRSAFRPAPRLRTTARSRPGKFRTRLPAVARREERSRPPPRHECPRRLTRPFGARRFLQSHVHAGLHNVSAGELDLPQLDVEQRAGRLHARRLARGPESDEQPLVRPPSPPRTGHRGPGSKAGRGGARRATPPPRGGTPWPSARSRRTKAASRPAAASYRRTASGRSALGSAVRHSGSRPAKNRKASSRLPGAGLALMRKRTARSVAGSSPEGVALVHSSRRRMSKAAGSGVMAGSKAGSAKIAAPECRLPRHCSPKRLVSPRTLRRPPSRRRGVHPGEPANLPARMSPRGSSPRSPAGRPVDHPESGEPR